MRRLSWGRKKTEGTRMKIVLSLILLIPFLAHADDISNYKFYANNGSYMAYVKKSDHCIYGGYIKDNNIHRYCEIDNIKSNLEKSHPSVYVSRFSLFGSYLDVVIAAPWNEQKCRLDLLNNNISCKPTEK